MNAETILLFATNRGELRVVVLEDQGQARVEIQGERLVAAADDSSIRWWDLSQAKPRERNLHQGPSSHVKAVAVSPDGQTLVAGGAWDTNLYRWRGTAGMDTPAKLGGHGDGICCLSFAHDGGWLASGSYDKTVRLWPVGDANRPSQVLFEHPNWVRGVAFSLDGAYVATACHDGSVRIWRRHGAAWTGPTLLPVRQAVLASITFTPDGRHLVGGTEDGRVAIWAAPIEGTSTPRISGEHGAEVCLAMPPGMKEFEAQFLSAGLDGSVHLWDARTGRLQRSWNFPGGLQSACFAPDGRRVALGRANGTLYVLRLAPAAAPGARPGVRQGR